MLLNLPGRRSTMPIAITLALVLVYLGSSIFAFSKS
jgi:hypothetical protein